MKITEYVAGCVTGCVKAKLNQGALIPLVAILAVLSLPVSAESENTGASAGEEAHYISIGEMAEGFSEFNLPQTADLKGRTLTLHAEIDGAPIAIEYQFVSEQVLRWEIVAGANQGSYGFDEYIGTHPRDGFYFVEYIAGSNDAQMVSFVLDFNRGIATWVFGDFPKPAEDALPLYQRTAKGLSINASNALILNASIDKPIADYTPRHILKSDDLVGERRLYQYSQKDAYEHIYLENNLFTWHCISGNEKGLADTDFAQIIKFEEGFYMIVWVEKIMHIVSTITLNFDSMRSSGAMASFAGWDYGEIVNVSSGAIITELPGVDRSDYKLQ